MKIGLVIEQLDPRRGGVEQWTWQYALSLLREGHEVHLIAQGCSPEASASGLIVHMVRSGEERSQFAQQAAAKLQTLSLDVVHDTGCGWSCDLFQPHGGSRVAAFEQNLQLLPLSLRFLKRQAVKCLPRYRDFARLNQQQYGDPRRIYLALSQMVARDFQRFHGLRSEQIRIVYNGVDCARFTPELRDEHRDRVRRELNVREDETLLLIVAHNYRLKGVPTLIRALGRLVEQGQRVKLAIVGGKRFGSYQRLAARCGCAAQALFLGSQSDPTPFYAAADVYVQPTFYDPCSLVVLEALACGLPVITSRYNGAGELITPGVEGAIIDDPADDRELTQALIPLLDRDAQVAMGAAARRLALEHSWQRNCRELLTVYDEIVRSRRAAA